MPRKIETSKKQDDTRGIRFRTDAERVIRDSFTMPAVDYDLIGDLKSRCIRAGVSVNKSQLLRAGLNVLESMSDEELIKVIDRLIEVKPGRRRE
jgi:hypothetical protein